MGEHKLTDSENVTSVQAFATAPDYDSAPDYGSTPNYDTAQDYDAQDSDTTPQIGLCSTPEDIRGPNEEVTDAVFRKDRLDFFA